MRIIATPGWDDYQLLDSGEGKRLEKYGDYTLSRPDPQCIWQKSSPELWGQEDAMYEGDAWTKRREIPEKFLLRYQDLAFYARLTPFKHTGIFPEQQLQWDFMREMIRSEKREVKVLNLFGYTGMASLACAAEGAHVTHVDASRPAIGWARENQDASGLSDKPIRWILEDAMKFCEREVRRGNHYDAILMDPPIYGHGPDGERWDFFESVPKLLRSCRTLLSDDPLFVLINAYAISASSVMLENLVDDMMEERGGIVESGELALKEKNTGRLLSTGIFSRWRKG